MMPIKLKTNKTNRFYIKYQKTSGTFDYSGLVNLIVKMGPCFRQLRFNNPIGSGENRTRKLNGNEMLELGQDVARATPKT